MDENKSGLYIVAIVGVIAVVALVVLVLGVGSNERVIYTGTSATEDSAGQVMQAVIEDNDNSGIDSGAISSGTPTASYGRIIALSTTVCSDTDNIVAGTDTIGNNLKLKGTATKGGSSYTDTCVLGSTETSSCSGSICYIKEYSCFRPYLHPKYGYHKLGSQYALEYGKIPCSNCVDGVCLA